MLFKDADNPYHLSSRLKRQIKRHLGLSDSACDLNPLLDKIKNNQPLSDEDYLIFTGFLDFVTSVDSSYSESDDKFRMALRNLEVSSEELNILNGDLEGLNKKINAMLDSLGQGLLFFDSKGICSEVHSKACTTLFLKAPADKCFIDLFPITDEQRDDFELWLTIVFDENTPVAFDDLKTLIPQSFETSDGRFIELDYRPLYLNTETIDGVLCIATDKTFERRAKDEMAKREEDALRIRMVASNRNEFHRFVSELDSFAEYLLRQKKTIEDGTSLITTLHNFKGISAVFYFRDLVKSVHHLENLVKSRDYDLFINAIDNTLPLIYEQKQVAQNLGLMIFGNQFLSPHAVMMIDSTRISEFRDVLKASDISPDILALYDTAFLTTPLQDCFRAFQMELNRVALSQGKLPIHFTITGGEIRVNPKYYSDLFDSLMHLARNIVDHGIEMPDIREASFKHPYGEVNIIAKTNDEGKLILTIRDDGTGLSIDAIKTKLKSLGIFNEEEGDTEILQHIFDADFSTRTDTSLLSGRGIGMYAVKQEVEKLGGVIFARNRSCMTCGAEFVIRLPHFKN